MKTYKFYHKSGDYRSISLKGTELENALSSNPFTVRFEDFSDTEYSWVNQKDVVSDAPFIDGCIPVLSQRAFDVLGAKICDNTKSIRIFVEDQPFYILYDEQIIEGALNFEKSIIRFFRDGRIMQIKKYAFKNKQYPSIFKIKEDLTFDFVTEDVIQLIIDAKLVGFDWEECLIE